MENNWDRLVQLLTEIQSPQQMSAMLDYLLTMDEKHQLANRLALTELMLNGQMPQREIAKNLNISISTVTRCSNALKHLDDELKSHFK
ncbi:MAG: trp operon repressor [Francisellaceae bacterium]